jgi:hypothetical protein
MIECHDLPSVKQRVATYYRYINQVKQALVVISKGVFLERNSVLETGMLGTVYRIQISTSQINFLPKANDIIVIDSIEYKITSNPVQLYNNNPYFVPFYESELKNTQF